MTAIHLRFDKFRTIRGHTICESLIDSSGTIIDAGAHKLEFAKAARVRYRCRVIALEPNKTLTASDSFDDELIILNSVIAPNDGVIDLYLSDNLEASSVTESSNLRSIKVEAISAKNILYMQESSEVHLLKLDIEGSEYGVLRSLSSGDLENVRQISVEFHDFLPQFANRGLTEEMVEHLRSCGFIDLKCSYNTSGDYLFVNKRFIKLGAMKLSILRKILPYVRKFNILFVHGAR